MPQTYDLSTESIAAIVGIALSLLLTYAPQFREAWAEYPGSQKRLILGVFCLTAAVAILVTRCGGQAECYSANWFTALRVAISTWAGTQLAYVWTGTSDK